MKWRVMLFMCLLCLLTGCAAETARETVTDEAVETFSADHSLLRIHMFVPEEMAEQPQSPADSEKRYLHRDGTAELSAGNLRATSAENAIYQLSGKQYDELTIIETKRFGLPEFRFTWYEENGDGGTVCRADMVQDQDVFYYVQFSVREDAGNEYDQMMAQVFSTFGLSVDEGF